MRTYVGTAEAQKILGVSRRTLYRMIHEARISGVKVGGTWRFAEDQLRHQLTGKPMARPAAPAAGAPPVSQAVARFERVYGGQVRRNLQAVLRHVKPDLLVFKDREARRLFVILGLLPPEHADHVTYMSALRHRSRKHLREKIALKSLLLLDDVAERARGLSANRELLEKCQARVHTAALCTRKEQIVAGKIEEFGLHRGLELGDADYRRFTALLSQVLLENAPRLDVDHLVVRMPLPPDRVAALKVLCAGLGRYHETQCYLGSTEHATSWTLDDPTFLRLPRKALAPLRFDGVAKLRFSYRPADSFLEIAVIVAPSMTVDLRAPLDGLLSVLGGRRARTVLPSDFGEMEPAYQARYIYEASLLLLAAEVARQFLMVLGENRAFGASSRVARLHQEDALSCFDPNLDTSLLRLVEQIVNGAPLVEMPDTGDYLLPGILAACPEYIRPLGIVKQATSCWGSLGGAAAAVISAMKRSIVQLQRDGRDYDGHAIGLAQLEEELIESEAPVDYRLLSLCLDVLLELPLMKPRNQLVRVQGSVFECARGYLLSERTGMKEDPDSPTGFIESKSETSKHLTAERGIVLVENAVRYLQRHLGIDDGLVEFFLEKVLCNVRADWDETEDAFPLAVMPYRFGGFVLASQPISAPTETVPLSALCEKSPLLTYDRRQRKISFKTTPEAEAVLDAKTEELLSFAERTQLEALLRGYCYVLEKMDGNDCHNPEALLTMSLSRSLPEAYAFVHVELPLWLDDIRGALVCLKTAIRLRALQLAVPPPVETQFSSHMRNADTAPREIVRKMNLFTRQPRLIEKLAALPWPESTVKQRILRNLPPLDTSADDSQCPVVEVVHLAGVLRSTNAFLAQVFAVVSQHANAAPQLRQSVAALAKQLPRCRDILADLERMLTTDSLQDVGACLDHLVDDLESRSILLLPDPKAQTVDPVESLLHLYSLITDRLHASLARFGESSEFAVAFVDILGFQPVAEDLVQRGDFATVEDARVHLRAPVDDAINACASQHRECFATVPVAVGGDAWLLVFPHAKTCLDVVIALLAKMQADGVPRLPIVGLSWGHPYLQSGGALDRWSVMAYLLTEKQKYLRRRPGMIIAGQTFTDALGREDADACRPFRQVGKKAGYTFPGCGKTQVRLYACDWQSPRRA